MFGLLSKKPALQNDALKAGATETYTRFQERPESTRFANKHTRRVPAQAATDQGLKPRPAPETSLIRPKAVPVKIDEIAHLHAESKVSVSILRKALPLRFAAMRDQIESAAAG